MKTFLQESSVVADVTDPLYYSVYMVTLGSQRRRISLGPVEWEASQATSLAHVYGPPKSSHMKSHARVLLGVCFHQPLFHCSLFT